LQTKESATVFLFDEADNALDQDNQKKFQERIKELAKNKLVIYIKH
jgi:ABC-type bacteriocin/lantibiotic exporter with double-glycine peptidase domain